MSAHKTLPDGSSSFHTTELTTGVRESSPTLVDGRYRLVEKLGSGGMGIVYRADDVWLGRPVALKVMHATSARDELLLESFKKEARVLARLRHDNVVQIYTFGPNGPSFYLAMEYVAGKNLDTVIEEHAAAGAPMDLARVSSIVRDIGRGLTAVHAAGIVHRDVKPSNVVIEETTGKPVLVDFGMARRRASSPEMALTGGTPFYMAPEQIVDAKGTNTTAQADLYALACTAFELLTGRCVFSEGDDFDVLRAHLSRPAPRISSVRRELAPLDPVFVRALAKDPSARQPSCDAFASALEAASRRVRTSPSEGPEAPRLRVVVLEADDALARHLGRIVERTLESAGDSAEVDVVTTCEDLAATIDRMPADIVIVDEESLGGESASTIAGVRAQTFGEEAEIVVLRRAFVEGPTRPPTSMAERVTELPKPVNPRVLGSVLARLVGRIVERGAARPSGARAS